MDFSINSLPRSRVLWISVALGMLVWYLVPMLRDGGSLYYLAFDNLDSNVAWFKVLAHSGSIFASNDTIIPNIMNGLPRGIYGRELNVLLWLYYFFPPLEAYIVNEILIHTTAFFSMYVFLDRIVFRKDDAEKTVYVVAGSLYFALLPFWPSAGLSIPLMPLATYALLKIERHESSWREWIILVLMPLYTEFILVYIFYFFVFGLYFVRQWIVLKSFNTRLFFALFFWLISYVLVNYRLFLQMLFEPSFISDRIEYYALVNKNFFDSYRNALLEFINGVPHAKGMQLPWLLPVSILVMVLMLLKEKLSPLASLVAIAGGIVLLDSGYLQSLLKQKYTLIAFPVLLLPFVWLERSRIIASLLLAQVVIAVWFGFSFYRGWQSIFEWVPQLQMFNFSRFFFLSEMIWALLFAYVARVLLSRLRGGIILVGLLVVLQFNVALKARLFGYTPHRFYLPFERYYAQAQFESIKRAIGKPQESYRIVSLGIHPAVLQYNGFYTLDGYMVNYPLRYKHEFRKIIEKFLSENAFYKDVFDGWGSKLYLFNPGVALPYHSVTDVVNTQKKSYRNINIDTAKIYKMGGRYLLSAEKIDDAQSLQLKCMGSFPDENSIWKPYLYKIAKANNKD